MPEPYLARLLEHSSVESVEELIDKKAAYTKLILDAFDKLFADLPSSQQEIDDWQEQAVIWT